MIKVAVYLAEGFEEMEAIIPVDVWRRAGYQVTTISVSGNKEVTGSHNITLKPGASISNELLANDFDIHFLPGGTPGAFNLAESKIVCERLMDAYRNEKHIAAICAAPLVLGRLGLLRSKKATCYPGFEKELIDADLVDEYVVTDGSITTGKGAGVAMNLALEIVSLFSGKSMADSLRRKMQIPD